MIPPGSRNKKARGLMTKMEEAWTQLTSRIPKELHHRLRLHCVTNDIAVMHFVAAAIEEKLGRILLPRRGRPKRARRAS